jgi:cell division septation protein DedD
VDAPIKERLTGALILVALLVIVVPEMVSGPGDAPAPSTTAGADAGPPVRTYSLQLETPTTARSQDQSALAPQSVAAAPPPAVSASPQVQDEPAAPAPVAEVTVPDVKPPATPVPSARDKQQWWTQLGSFSSGENAERLARQLRAAGYSINVARIRVGNKDLYRVRAGPEPGRDAAVALQARLAAAGHKSSLVAP